MEYLPILKTIVAIICVVVIGFFFLKKITGCIGRILLTAILLAVLLWALRWLGWIS